MSKPLYTIEEDTLTFDCTEPLEDGPGEEDGPWADGWEKRAGENKDNVVELFRD